MSENKVAIRKVINASRQELFEAFTNPVIMSKWFFPEKDMSVEVTNEFSLGSAYVLKMHTGKGDVYTHVERYKKIVPPEKLVFTWNSDFVENTVVTLVFSESETGTVITITYDLTPSEEMADDHKKGWTGFLNRLGSTMVG